MSKDYLSEENNRLFLKIMVAGLIYFILTGKKTSKNVCKNYLNECQLDERNGRFVFRNYNDFKNNFKKTNIYEISDEEVKYWYNTLKQKNLV